MVSYGSDGEETPSDQSGGQTDGADKPVTIGLAFHRTLTVTLVTVHAALRIFLGNALTLRITIHSLTRATMVPFAFR